MGSHHRANSGGRAPISIANVEGISFAGYKWGEARSIWDSLTGSGAWGLRAVLGWSSSLGQVGD